MKYYELIETYPGSPPIGTIISQSDINSSLYFYTTPEGTDIEVKNPDDFPDFWRKFECNYEILSYNLDGLIYVYAGNQNLLSRYAWPKAINRRKYYAFDNIKLLPSFIAPSYASPKGLKIHSVKRLSDSQVFTVGDILSRNQHTFTLQGFVFTTKAVEFPTVFVKSEQSVSLGLFFLDDLKKSDSQWKNIPCLSFKEIAPIIGLCNDSKTIDLDKLTQKIKNLVISKQNDKQQ